MLNEVARIWDVTIVHISMKFPPDSHPRVHLIFVGLDLAVSSIAHL